jgi:hypothetical protein
MMTDLEIKHLKLDLALNDEIIANALKEQHGWEITARYVGMILKRERTGYKYRGAIARMFGKRVDELFGPTKKRKKKEAARPVPSQRSRQSEARKISA